MRTILIQGTILGMILAGCGGSSSQQGTGGGAPQRSADAANDKAGTKGGKSDKGRDADDGDRDGDDEGRGGSGGGRDVDGVEATDGAGCGDFFSQKLKGNLHIMGATQTVLGNINYDVKADVGLGVEANQEKGVLSMNGSLTSVSPALARSIAQQTLDAIAQPTELGFVAPGDRAALAAKSKAWDGIRCALTPLETFSTRGDDGDMVVKFSPAIPIFVSPIAPDVEGELKDGGVFDGITATWVKTPDGQGQGESAKGKVTVTKIDTGKDGLGGDVAYRIQFDFGDYLPLGFSAVEYHLDIEGQKLTGAALEIPMDKTVRVVLKP